MANFHYVCALFALCVAVYAEDEVTELKIDVLGKPEKCEKKSKRLDMLSMHYTGTLTDGSKFDSSHDHGQPFQFQLGIGQVIKGWDQGLSEMCIGEKRKLTIPHHLGYGEQGAGDKIPAKATLVFEVELLDIQDGPKPENIFKKIDSDADNQLSREEISKFIIDQSESAGSKVDDKSGEHDKVVESIFQHEDKDKDGFISHEEFSGPKHDEL